MQIEVIHVVANPEAAGGRGRRTLERVRREIDGLRIPSRLHVTRGPGDAEAWARELPDGLEPGPILVVGGDGTLHEVANGLMTRPGGAPQLNPLLVLPVGTGNDFHRMLRASGRFDETIALIEGGAPRTFDVGRVRFDGGERHFVNLLGVGIDVAVLQRRARFAALPGLLQYLAALLLALVRFRPLPVRVEYEGSDGGSHRLEAGTLLTAVTVGPSVGGGFRLAPNARPDDGLLDLFQVERLSFFEIVRILPRVMRGTQREGSRVHLRTFRRAVMRRSDGASMTFELDGEVMTETTRRLEIDIVPAALSFIDRPTTSVSVAVEGDPEAAAGANDGLRRGDRPEDEDRLGRGR